MFQVATGSLPPVSAMPMPPAPAPRPPSAHPDCAVPGPDRPTAADPYPTRTGPVPIARHPIVFRSGSHGNHLDLWQRRGLSDDGGSGLLGRWSRRRVGIGRCWLWRLPVGGSRHNRSRLRLVKSLLSDLRRGLVGGLCSVNRHILDSTLNAARGHGRYSDDQYDCAQLFCFQRHHIFHTLKRRFGS